MVSSLQGSINIRVMLSTQKRRETRLVTLTMEQADRGDPLLLEFLQSLERLGY